MKAKIVLAAIVAMMMVAVMPAAAVNVTDTVAVVTGSGTPPVIEEKFELNDDGDPSHTEPGTQVQPVPDADKEVCAYVVVSDPNGAADINRIWMTVDDPNNVQVAYGATDNSPVNIFELSKPEMLTATQAAFDQGLIIDARRIEINNHTSNNEWRMWKFCFDLSNCDPSGNYTVTAKANDGIGGTGSLANTFEYLSIKELAIDFNLVNYTTILPGVKQIVSGDNNFGTADAPTVRNRANDPFKLKIYATDMVGTDPNNVIDANHLDSKVYGVDAPGGSAVSQELNLRLNGRIFTIPIIDTCTIEPIDFSLLQNSICSDTYTGTITLEAIEP